MIGTTVSHYKILEKLGEGGMGEVFLAEDTKLRRKVALKFLPVDLTKDQSRKQRFVQEARAAAAMEHPNIAAIYDIDEVDGRTFIAMEYVRGESLRDAIRDGKLRFRKSLELASQIAEGLAKAHERGVVHRDLKPENVLLSEDGYAKIIDFGLAKLSEPRATPVGEPVEHEAETLVKTQAGLVLGTVAYMSPEQARAKSIDARTDIFSFGVVFHEMLAGESPFKRSSVAETLSAILKESPSPLPEDVTSLAPELPSMLRKALAKEPASRYQRMRDLANDVRELRDALGSAVRPLFSRLRVPKNVRAAVLAVGAIALATLSVYILARSAEPTGIGASGRPAIAVMYFEDNTGSEEIRWLSKGLPNMLLTDLAQTPGLDVVSRQRIQQILKQVGEDQLEALDASLVPEIARRAGAGAVVGGSIYKLGDEIRIDVQVEDVESGRILSAHSVRGDEVFPLVDELTGRIRASLNMTDVPLERGIAEVTTPSLEAYRLYNEGREAIRLFRWADAREQLEKAIEIDPAFALAYFELSNLSGLWADDSVQEGYRAKVREHLDRLPERRRLLIEATYALRSEQDPEKARELLEDLVARYPDEEDAYLTLSIIYEGPLNQREEALATLSQGTANVPRSGALHNQYGYYLLYQGRYPEAFRELETYAEINPEEANPFDSMAEAYLFTGQPEKALESYSRALEVDPSFFNAHTGRAWAAAMLGRYDEARDEMSQVRKAIAEAGFQNLEPTTTFVAAFLASRVGRYQEAEEHIARGLELAESLDQPPVAAPLLLLSAALALEREDYSRVVETTLAARKLFPELNSDEQRKAQSLFADLLAGTAEARTGNIEAARARLGAQREQYDPERDLLNWAYHALEGEVALTAGDLEQAAAAFVAAEPEIKMHLHMTAAIVSLAANNPPLRDGMARVKKAQGDLEGAIGIYRSLLRPDISAKWTAMLEPRYVLELARLLAETGDTAAARTEYERFLDLWKHADPGLPELEEARLYLQGTLSTGS
jgi:tetratricopeptide (TPR) repeat protein/predicted Ser/Thr protein kinase